MENPRTPHSVNCYIRHWSAGLLIGLMLVTGLTGCANAADTQPLPTLNFTLSWNDPKHANLKLAGGYTTEQGVLIAHLKDGGYVAVSSSCTFENTKLVYRLSSDRFYCPTDGSTFDTQGKPINGPATKPLTVFTVIASKTTNGLFTITN